MRADCAASASAVARRRSLLELAAGLGGLALAPGVASADPAMGLAPSLLVSGCRTAEGRMALAMLEEGASSPKLTPLPARAHQVLVADEGATVYVVARRPGRSVWVVDRRSGRLLRQIDCAPDRHLCGHALIVQNQWLLCTENDNATSSGHVVVRDLANGRVLADYSSGGIGPHAIDILPDRKTLVIANGGIRTRPDRPNDRLNLDTMRSTLAYVDLQDGRLIASWASPHQRLSLRHLAVADNGTVVFGMQYQGPWSAAVGALPLLGHHQGQGPLQLIGFDASTNPALAGYVGSVAVSPDGRRGCATSPRGAKAIVWSLPDGQALRVVTLPDVGGVAHDPRSAGFVFSTGTGVLHGLVGGDRQTTVAWDNHLAIAT